MKTVYIAICVAALIGCAQAEALDSDARTIYEPPSQTDAMFIPVPKGLTAYIDQSSVRVTWLPEEIQKVKYYHISRVELSTSVSKDLGTTTKTSYLDNQVTPGRAYRYNVKGVIGSLEGRAVSVEILVTAESPK
jgi:hypothetical protein